MPADHPAREEDDAELREHLVDLEVKLAYQERLIRDLDALVRDFGTRLDTAVRELKALEQTVRGGTVPLGPATERPPHY